MKKIYLLLITILVSCSSTKDYNIKTVSVKEFKDFRIGEVVRNCSDYSLAKENLYFEPTKEFYEGICELYYWIKETEF